MRRIILLLSVLLVSVPLRAQRTANRTYFTGVDLGVSAYSIPSGAIGLYFGQYLINSYWKLGVSATDYNQKVIDSESTIQDMYFDHIHWKAYGQMMYRAFASYKRNINFYIGGSVFLGCNSYQQIRRLPSHLGGSFPKAEFIYGLSPEVELECYVSKRSAIVIGIQSPLCFGTSLEKDIWHLTGTIGYRYNF